MIDGILITLNYLCYVAKGNHTFAVLKAEEKYDTVKSGMVEVISTINAFVSNPSITINDITYRLMILLGSDYKVKSIIIWLCLSRKLISLMFAVSFNGARTKPSSFHLCMCLVSCT